MFQNAAVSLAALASAGNITNPRRIKSVKKRIKDVRTLIDKKKTSTRPQYAKDVRTPYGPKK